MLSCLNGRFCVLSMTKIQTTFNMHTYNSSVLTFVSRVVLQRSCPDHRLLCVPLKALLQDTAAAPPLPPTSRSTSTDRIGSRVPAVLLSSKVYQLLIYARFLPFESHRIPTAHVLVLLTLPNAVTKFHRCNSYLILLHMCSSFPFLPAPPRNIYCEVHA